MSGSKRGTSYRKGVTQQYDADDVDVSELRRVARVVENKGGSHFSLHLPTDTQHTTECKLILATLPSRFKNLIWIKRSDFVVVEVNEHMPAKKNGENKHESEEKLELVVEYEINCILNKQHIKALKAQGKWPLAFANLNESSGDELIANGGGGGVAASATVLKKETNDYGVDMMIPYSDEYEYDNDNDNNGDEDNVQVDKSGNTLCNKQPPR